MGRLLVGLVLVAGCGRLGFGERAPAPDAADVATADAPVTMTDDAGVARLACGAPTRFEIGAASVTAITSASNSNGFSVFAADSSGALRGLAYGFSAGAISQTADLALDSGVTGSLGATATSTGWMLTSLDGMPTATGTSVFALDGALGQAATPSVRAGEFAADQPIATSAAGTVAFVTIDSTTGEVDGRALAADGTDVAMPVMLVPGAAMAMNVSIAPAPTGFVLAYSSGAASPTQVSLMLVDDNLAVTAGPTTVDNAAGNEYRPHVVFAGGVFLVVWHAKNATDDDDVWIAVRGANLQAQGLPKTIATFSDTAVVASDADGFWLAWETYSPTPTTLGGAHVALDGTVTPRPVPMSGGTPGTWAMTTREGQAVLTWTEVGGSGPDLYLDPMCP